MQDAKILFDYIKSSTPEKPALVSGVFDRIDVDNSPFIQGVINLTFSDQTGQKIWKDCILKNEQRQILMQKDELEKKLSSASIDERKTIAKKLFELDIKIAQLKAKINN